MTEQLPRDPFGPMATELAELQARLDAVTGHYALLTDTNTQLQEQLRIRTEQRDQAYALLRAHGILEDD